MIPFRWVAWPLLLVVGIFSSCGTKKVLIEQPADAGLLDAAAHLQQIARHQLQADWLNSTAKLSYDDGSFSIGATATIKMQKDKSIWMSVRKLGFEVGRAFITPDSVFVLDRMNNAYAAEPLSYIAETYNLPADLGMMQQILLGNPVFMETNSPQSKVSDATLHWSAGADTGTRNDYWFTLPNYQLEKADIRQSNPARQLLMVFSNYQHAGANQDFSYLRTIQLASRETGNATVTIEFTKVELNVPADISFQIPPNYSRMGR
ncbi:MAG: DUF4292 domain-containing protein [Saprospiraceae bacterium]